MNKLEDSIKLLVCFLTVYFVYFVGGIDGQFTVLLSFMCADYITGVLNAIKKKRLNSKIGFKGITKKVLIVLLVGLTNILELSILHTNGALRTAVILFYVGNEGISILENCNSLGLAIPEKLKNILDELKRGGKDE